MILFKDNFSGLREGPIKEHIDGAFREMHAQPSHPLDNLDGWQHKTGDFCMPRIHWECVETKEGKKLKSIISSTVWENNSIAKGSIHWKNYEVNASVKILDKEKGWGGAVGVIFRFIDSTQFYAAIIDRDQHLKIIKAAHINNYDVLASKKINLNQFEKEITFLVKVKNDQIQVKVGNCLLKTKDSEFPNGMVGFLANQPALMGPIEVNCDEKEKVRLEQLNKNNLTIINTKRENAGQAQLIKQINTKGFGSGRRIRLGDLTGDGTIDFLHTRLDPEREPGVGSLVAQSSSGEVLWQRGELPPLPIPETSGDSAVQIHDIDLDGHNEVICAMGFRLYILDGKTGKVKKERDVPKGLPVSAEYKRNLNTWGECFDDEYEAMPCIAITLVDFQGKGKRTDIVLSGHHHQTMVFDNQLNLLWQGIYCHGHYPIPYRPKGEKFDHLINGYHHLNHRGEPLGRVCLMDHQDAIFIGPLDEKGQGDDQILMAAGEDGLLHMTTNYHIRQRHMGHVQRLSVGKFRKELSGQCVATVLFHGNRGIVSLYDSTIKRLWTKDFPVIGATLQPVIFDTSGEERMLLSGIRPAHGYQGGLIDGHGDLVTPLPDDDGPGFCSYAHDFDQDGFDELMLWDHDRIWIYESNAKTSIKKPMRRVRPPLYNMSNFQSYYSLPPKALVQI